MLNDIQKKILQEVADMTGIPDGAVRAALESGEIEQTRYDSYVRLYELAKEIKEWELNP